MSRRNLASSATPRADRARHAHLPLLALIAACIPGPRTIAPAQDGTRGAAVVIDGAFDDWTGVRSAVSGRAADSVREGPAPVEVAVRDDAQWVYLRLRFARPVNLLGLDGTLTILVNADGDRGSGKVLDGVRGADVAVDFSPRDSLGRPSQGVQVRLLGPGVLEARRDPYGLDLVSLPTHASTEFEMRLARGRALGATSGRSFLADRYDLQVVYRNARGERVGGLAAFEARLATRFAEPAPLDQPTDPLARAPATSLRVVQWNMSDEGLVERPEYFRRILRALDADVLVLDEVADNLGREGMGRFLASVDSGRARAAWQFTFGEGGGYQRTAIASRNAVTELPELRRISFPDSVMERIVAMAPAANGARLRANMVEGVAAGGARVRTPRGEVWIVGVDLQSAGNDSASWQEARRRAEARLIGDALVRAMGSPARADPGGRAAPYEGLVIAGDFNLVGTDVPLSLLRDSLGLPFRVVPARQLDGRTMVTWDGREGPFAPGRLDWFLALRLTPGRAFAFETRDLLPRWLQAHGLRADDSHLASDHLPIVVDLAWERP